MSKSLRFLVADPNAETRQSLRQALTTRRLAEVVEVGSAEESRALLSDGSIFDMVFVDETLTDQSGLLLTRWIRRDQASPRPNLPVILMSANSGPELASVATQIGARMLPKPFNQGRAVLMVEKELSAYPNFIVSPSFFGHDRRAEKRPIGGERRTAMSTTVQIVDDPNDYVVGKDTIVVIFDYLKLRISGASPDVFRDFLMREHLQRAAENIPLIQERMLGKVIQTQEGLDQDLNDLMGGANGSTLKKMHRSSRTMMIDTATAGFVLMSAIATSLHHYTAETHSISDRLIRFLGAHVTAIRSAISYRIFDDGGTVGQSIVGALKVAEGLFRRPSEA